jgi:hypothetical protein
MYHCVINYKNANHQQKSNIMKTKIILSLVCILFAAKLQAQNWLLTGNAGTTATQFIGTTDAKDLRLNTNGTNRMTISSAGYTGFNIAPETISRVFSNFTAPNPFAQNSFYAAMKGRITSTTARANGYLGVFTGQAISTTGLPTSLNYIGVLGVKEDGSDFGAGVLGWNKNNNSGGTHYGMYGLANGSLSIGQTTDRNVGVFASGNINNYGVWGYATGTGNFAGYFTGRGHFSDRLGVGTESPTAMISVNAPTSTALLTLSSNGANKVTVGSTR